MKQKISHGLTLRFLSILLFITLFITSFIANPVKAEAGAKPVKISNVTVAADDLTLKLGEKIPILDKRPKISGFDCCDQIDYTFELLKKEKDGTYNEYDNDTHTITEGTYKYRLVLYLKNEYIDFSLDPNFTVTVNKESWNDIKTESDDAGTKLLGLECYSKEINVTENGTSTQRVDNIAFSISGFSKPVFNGNVPNIEINVETPGVTVNESKTGWYYCAPNSEKYDLFTGNTFNDEGLYELVIYFDSKDAVLDKYTTIAEKQDSGKIIINCFMNGENFCAETTVYGLYLNRKVTFELDGKVFVTKDVKYGDHVAKPDTPRKPADKETAEFAGWFTDQQFTKKYDFSESVYNDMTLYATWVSAPKSCENGSFVDENGVSTAIAIPAKIDASFIEQKLKELTQNAQRSIDSISVRPKVKARKKSSVPKGTTDKIQQEAVKAGSPLENTDTNKQSTDLFDVSLELMVDGQKEDDIKDLNGKYAEIIVPFPDATSVDKAVVTHVKDDGTIETLAEVPAGTFVTAIKQPSYALDAAGLHLYGTTYSIYAITYTTKTNNNTENEPDNGNGSSPDPDKPEMTPQVIAPSFNDLYMESTKVLSDLINNPASFTGNITSGTTVKAGDATITKVEAKDGTVETVIEYSSGDSLPLSIMSSLKDSLNVRLIFSYSYKDADYKVEITSEEAALFFDPDIAWYGPLWLNGYFSDEARKARKASK